MLSIQRAVVGTLSFGVLVLLGGCTSEEVSSPEARTDATVGQAVVEQDGVAPEQDVGGGDFGGQGDVGGGDFGGHGAVGGGDFGGPGPIGGGDFGGHGAVGGGEFGGPGFVGGGYGMSQGHSSYFSNHYGASCDVFGCVYW